MIRLATSPIFHNGPLVLKILIIREDHGFNGWQYMYMEPLQKSGIGQKIFPHDLTATIIRLTGKDKKNTKYRAFTSGV